MHCINYLPMYLHTFLLLVAGLKLLHRNTTVTLLSRGGKVNLLNKLDCFCIMAFLFMFTIISNEMDQQC